MAATHVKEHDFHIVNPSPWPVTASISALAMAIGLIIWMRTLGGGPGLFGVDGPWFFVAGFAGVSLSAFFWWRDVIREANAGDHTPVVQLHFRYGMILFIASEVMFFVAWFWAYFDASIAPDSVKEIARSEFNGGVWPPAGIEIFDPWHLPLLNTLILLCSGTTVTWAHHSLIHGDREGLKKGLWLTILLGAVFTAIQAYEYAAAPFAFGGNTYSSAFYMATGFHGFHVLVGTIFLIVCLVRTYKGHFTPRQHFGFEAAAWYWHFVDVVW
ncbi:MAG: cytochrome c oxidase subunit 3, partial [Hyphomicrobiaceae bacterium]|nr:cytochrome c oxidase subunit 3 [Hyphomicrobiaceae bacterium]